MYVCKNEGKREHEHGEGQKRREKERILQQTTCWLQSPMGRLDRKILRSPPDWSQNSSASPTEAPRCPPHSLEEGISPDFFSLNGTSLIYSFIEL